MVDRKYISAQLNLIRAFRNRIFHYEKIVQKPKYENIEDNVYEILNYLHIELYSYVKRVNR